MQNKPNFLRGQINATLCAAKDYENKWQRRVRKNKPNSNPKRTQNEPKTNPIQTQSSKGQIQCNPLCRKGLRQQTTPDLSKKRTQNEPKTNPKRTQFHTLSNAEGPPQTPHSSQLPTTEIKALRRAFFPLAHKKKLTARRKQHSHQAIYDCCLLNGGSANTMYAVRYTQYEF